MDGPYGAAQTNNGPTSWADDDRINSGPSRKSLSHNGTRPSVRPANFPPKRFSSLFLSKRRCFVSSVLEILKIFPHDGFGELPIYGGGIDECGAKERIRGSSRRRIGDWGEEDEKGRGEGDEGVAEIVLVLSAMGWMRGGKEATPVEKAMIAEGRAIVVEICDELAPRDILPREAFRGVIQDLRLNRLKEQGLGFRTPKLSIVNKMELAKQKMVESKAFAAQAASYPVQRLKNTTPKSGEGSLTNFHTFLYDR
ncbi:hypothetical protein Nepgr_007612 [Nepenthes gracilis]|uniref:DUF7797 domain-containing protein n=1 Tax=Nepenthes gracilis TaxID=150966 RepID=A0AAD3XIF0_NEPGR|nr:hypothetical protein Nepgr_007612 [Nepenthes gracilis]